MRRAMSPTSEKIAFQAETRELLQLVIHSLYKHREIFLRELVSNASDALDKLRFESLTRAELLEGDERLRIRLEADPEARVLRVIDNGIGMSREEVIENIGTIARSGTRGFVDALKASEGKADDSGTPDLSNLPDLIGQFGVGFYSAFMAADEVVLETRRAGTSAGTRWSSRGEGDYTIEDAEDLPRGTTVTLHLREPEADAEDAADFTREWTLREVVKRYSDFVAYPIEMDVEREEGEGDEKEKVIRTEVLNSQRPLWTRPKDDIEAEEHAEFYKHLAHDWTEPLETIHFKAEGTLEFNALLYVPRARPLDLFDPSRTGSRLHLYVRRVFIMADCEELLPPWLRFLRGVVDSSDLPLNVSRETLQENRQVRQIRKSLTRKTLDALRGMLDGRREDYGTFWTAFGPVLKEGLYVDDEHREELAKLLLAHSTAGDEPCTLDEYVERMPVKQKEIYVLPATDKAAAERSPHLEAFRAKGFEVLFLTDPVDEFVLQRLTEFESRPIRSIDKGEVDLDDGEDDEDRTEREEELKPLLELVRKELAEEVEEVRLSTRLTDSPAVLVSKASSFSPQVERMLRESGQPIPEQKRTLELNPGHPLIERLRDLAAENEIFDRFGDYCALLHGQALIAEGSPLPDPARFAKLVTELMVQRPGTEA